MGEALTDLLTPARHHALHLEMRDTYEGADAVAFAAWRAGKEFSPADHAGRHATIRPLVERGVDVRRARIVSEPVSEYIRFEYEGTAVASIAAGERVRWLPRHNASDLALPGNDFWLVDGTAGFLHFSGDGLGWELELVTNSAVVQFCRAAFEAVWERAVDHQNYTPR